jgi:hypothetical protein
MAPWEDATIFSAPFGIGGCCVLLRNDSEVAQQELTGRSWRERQTFSRWYESDEKGDSKHEQAI